MLERPTSLESIPGRCLPRLERCGRQAPKRGKGIRAGMCGPFAIVCSERTQQSCWCTTSTELLTVGRRGGGV
jgi:hypothetical protein